ncbi:hypothetical protein NW756_014005 [Fusarium oxysporum]|nr:hypothetical protein NW763_014281 [Fusarium oxysporum]KAJ4034520.1 hypothetical protein NW753_012402 [Fusarium oxysporum]KAJ4073914.1 hypothetical protein NW756_014005 [Fusarium oxysporum]
MKHSKHFERGVIILAALNYRLGARGFLTGSDVENDGGLNAGLLDQRLALTWVQDNICLFGGSHGKVTIMEESAGGGSVLFHMLNAGNQGTKAPFAQAIIESSALFPTVAPPKSAYSGFLEALKLTNLAETCKASSEAVIAANARQIGTAPAATYTHGTVHDCRLSPDNPYALFKAGQFNKSVKVLAADNSFKGEFFFDADHSSNETFSPNLTLYRRPV